jgi:hypothetical protein
MLLLLLLLLRFDLRCWRSSWPYDIALVVFVQVGMCSGHSSCQHHQHWGDRGRFAVRTHLHGHWGLRSHMCDVMGFAFTYV